MLISVIMPVYNSEKTILASVQSILNQIYSNWELILVDDGSTDNTIALVSDCKDQRIHIYKQKNLGVSIARNTGIQAASGKLVAFLDSDDIWHSEYLKTIFEMYQIYPDCSCYTTSYYFVDILGNKKKPRVKGFSFNNKYTVLDNYLFLLTTSDPVFYTCSFATKKDVLTNIGGFPADIVAGEDTITWIKLYLKYKVAHCITPLVEYNVPDPGTRKIRTREDRDNFAVELIKLKEQYPEQEELLGRLLSHWYKIRSSTYLQHGRNKLARKYCASAFNNSLQKRKLLVYYLLTLLPSNLSKTFFSRLIK